MAQSRVITISVPESHAKKIERTTGRELQVVLEEHALNWFEDHRRRQIQLKRQGISWHKEVYRAMLDKIGFGGISDFVRKAVYKDLSRVETGLVDPSGFRPGREKVSKTDIPVIPSDRLSVQAPILFPEQWIAKIEKRYPLKVSTYIKAVTQLELEKLLKKSLPVQRGLGVFMNR